MQLNDTKIQEFGRNDGIRSVFHCQEKFRRSCTNIHDLFETRVPLILRVLLSFASFRGHAKNSRTYGTLFLTSKVATRKLSQKYKKKPYIMDAI